MNIFPTFDEFWQIYPRKDSKKAAQRAWDKLSDENKFKAMQGLRNLVQHSKQYQSREFAPHASTFLNGERWNDEIDEPDQKERIVIDQDKSQVHAVWSAMLQIFGQPWINRYGEEPNELWTRMVNGYPREVVMRALHHCITSGMEFPPTLSQFKGWCRTFNANVALETGQKQLPRPDNRELALNSLAEAQRILKGAKIERTE